MRKIRAIRLVIRLFLLVLTLSLSLVSFLGGLSAVMILSDQNNVRVPDGEPNGNLTLYDLWSGGAKYANFNHVCYEIPFNITNAGYFTLQELKVRLSIGFIYDHIDDPGPGQNKTYFVHIFDREINFDPDLSGIPSGETLKSSFSAYYNETDPVNGGFKNFAQLPGTLSDIDIFTKPPSFQLNISLTCKYSIGLLSLRVDLYDVPLLATFGGF